jgi:hypothetical protein
MSTDQKTKALTLSNALDRFDIQCVYSKLPINISKILIAASLILFGSKYGNRHQIKNGNLVQELLRQLLPLYLLYRTFKFFNNLLGPSLCPAAREKRLEICTSFSTACLASSAGV